MNNEPTEVQKFELDPEKSIKISVPLLPFMKKH
jgi:hypothetical protein